MNDLDNLRPEVREAVREIAVAAAVARPDLQRSIATIRAELLRLVDENACVLAANRDCVVHFEQMRDELAALKVRIADGWLCGVSNDACPGNFDAAIYCLPSRFRGKRVRLLVEE